MPRNGSDIYSVPLGTDAIEDATIESVPYNNFLRDLEHDLNDKRPIIAGGTGADDADEALANLKGEKASQAVVNFDTHVFYPGSFYSATSATASPIAGHAFAGLVFSADPPASPPANQNVVLHARDMTDALGRMYFRMKKSGVWGPWMLDFSGVSGIDPPLNPPDNTLWFHSEEGQLYIYYNDGNTKQWVIASPSLDPAVFLNKAGDTMTGVLNLQAPTADTHAATKKYVDDAIAAAIAAL